jgi:hypothetical protein
MLCGPFSKVELSSVSVNHVLKATKEIREEAALVTLNRDYRIELLKLN